MNNINYEDIYVPYIEYNVRYNYSPFERDMIERIDFEDEYETEVEEWTNEEEAQRMSIETINFIQEIILTNTPLSRAEVNDERSEGIYSYLTNGKELIEICPICLDDVNNIETTSSLSCGHHFHTNCIRMCLERSLRCPLCRQDCLN